MTPRDVDASLFRMDIFEDCGPNCHELNHHTRAGSCVLAPTVNENPPLRETLSNVLFNYVGEAIPTSMLAEVSEWMAFTETLIEALRNDKRAIEQG